MKKWLTLVFIALIHFGCRDNTSAYKTEVNKIEKEWVLFESKEGGYSISHPDHEIKKSTTVNYNPFLGEYTVYLNLVNTQYVDDENLGYSFSHTIYNGTKLPFDKESIRERYKQNIYKKAENLNAEVDLLSFSDFKGVEMCEARISMEHQPIMLQVRLFIVDQREYELYVVMKDSQDFNESITRFFNSFEINGITTKL